MGKYEKGEDEKYGAINKPPMVKETLEKEFRMLRQKLRGKFPAEIPRDYGQAALWWMTHQKPASDRHERPRQVAIAGKDGTRWVNPYAERLVASLRRFVRLKPHEREFVLAATEDGVWYNGDSFEFFRKVYEETQRAQSMGMKKYREEAIGKLKALISGVA